MERVKMFYTRLWFEISWQATQLMKAHTYSDRLEAMFALMVYGFVLVAPYVLVLYWLVG